MNKLLLIIFVIGCILGISAGIYTSKELITVRSYDYICGIETTEWSNCSDGMWSDPNYTNKEKISLVGDIIPPNSKIYKGRETRFSNLQYGNTKEGCNGKLLFSVLSDNILKIKNSKNEIQQKIDILSGGVILLENEKIVKHFIPVEQRTCIKKELVQNVNTKSRTPVQR